MALWTLDTCGFGFDRACQLETDDQGIAIRHVRVCPNHAKLNWDHKAVEAENNRKNIAVGNLMDAKLIADATEISWAIDDQTRDLIISHPSASKADIVDAIAKATVSKTIPKV